ncbi:MAG: UTRA domain-containing protein [Erysipelotrichaceae bacterium]|jgi:DNA-binding GntR family transcriptional regulator|nr:UTRA domain-containing protein [Erysipelotrichaceae bacterium]
MTVTVTQNLDQPCFIGELLKQQKLPYHFQILENMVIEANKTISHKLQLPLASLIYVHKRLRVVEDLVRTSEVFFIDYRKVPEILNYDMSKQPLFTILKDHYHFLVVHSTQEVSIFKAKPYSASLFNVKPQTSLVRIESYLFDQNGEVLCYFDQYARPDFYCFKSESKV